MQPIQGMKTAYRMPAGTQRRAYAPRIAQPRFGFEPGVIILTAIFTTLGGAFIGLPFAIKLESFCLNRPYRFKQTAATLQAHLKFGHFKVADVQEAENTSRKERLMKLKIDNKDFEFLEIRGEVSDNRFFGGKNANLVYYKLTEIPKPVANPNNSQDNEKAPKPVELEWTHRSAGDKTESLFNFSGEKGHTLSRKGNQVPKQAIELFDRLHNLADEARKENQPALQFQSKPVLQGQTEYVTTTPAFEVGEDSPVIKAELLKTREART